MRDRAAPLSHPLDRPVWSALTGCQASLALTGGPAVRIRPDYGLFAATADPSVEAHAALAGLMEPGEAVWLVERAAVDPSPALRVERTAILSQMIAPAIMPGDPASDIPDCDIIVLEESDAAEMRALAHLTEPGPFLSLTHRFGRFVGVRRDGRLVAMAGERMRMEGFAEVSGVCTHPDHRGHGYAAGLMRHVAHRMIAQGETPFLHAYAANVRAVALYETLGFRTRADIVLTVATRP